MPTINYASKYSQAVDERFALEAITNEAVNNDIDFEGVSTVYIYDVDTAPMNNYTTSGTNRYGTPAELGDGTQTCLLSQDRSFTYTIDRKNYDDTMMTKEAGRSLARQIREVVIPEVDEYVLAKMISGAGYLDGTTLNSNAYKLWLDANANLDNNKVPFAGRVAFVSPEFLSAMKQDNKFILQNATSQEMLLKGIIGECDGILVKKAPASYLNGVYFVITHPLATSKAVKMSDYFIKDNVPGLSGWLVEGRIRYDAFVRKNKKGAIAVQVKGITTVSTAGSSGKTKLSATGIDLEALSRAGMKIYAKTAASVTAPSVGTDCSGWTELTFTSGVLAELAGTATHQVAIAVCDTAGKCIIPGTSVTIAVGA